MSLPGREVKMLSSLIKESKINIDRKAMSRARCCAGGGAG